MFLQAAVHYLCSILLINQSAIRNNLDKINFEISILAAAVAGCAFNLARELLSESLEKRKGPMTIFATLNSPDKDIRTYLILDRYCEEFKEMNPDLADAQSHIFSLVILSRPDVLKDNY